MGNSYKLTPRIALREPQLALYFWANWSRYHLKPVAYFLDKKEKEKPCYNYRHCYAVSFLQGF